MNHFEPHKPELTQPDIDGHVDRPLFPGVAEELGLNQLTSGVSYSDGEYIPLSTGMAGKRVNKKYTLDGQEYEMLHNVCLPPKKPVAEYDQYDCGSYNGCMFAREAIGRGLVIASDDHKASDIYGNILEDKSRMAVYVKPDMKQAVNDLRGAVGQYFGQKIKAETSIYLDPEAIFDSRELTAVFDALLRQDEFADLAKAADAHLERVKAKARAQRRSSIAL